MAWHAPSVRTTESLDAFRCPTCGGAVVTQSLARSLCRACHVWACNVCLAHGTVHVTNRVIESPNGGSPS